MKENSVKLDKILLNIDYSISDFVLELEKATDNEINKIKNEINLINSAIMDEKAKRIKKQKIKKEE